MNIALGQAKEAHERGEFPVGTVIVYQDQIIASGQRKHTGGDGSQVNEMDHAEIVALRNVLTLDELIPLGEATLYSTMEPCLMCFSTMILSGIRSVVYAYEDVMGGGTNLPLDRLRPLYADMDVTIVPAVLRDESLELFRAFFANPGNQYWKDSLLASYTLSQ
jgi:tRNA(adenine34) deaminase